MKKKLAINTNDASSEPAQWKQRESHKQVQQPSKRTMQLATHAAQNDDGTIMESNVEGDVTVVANRRRTVDIHAIITPLVYFLL